MTGWMDADTVLRRSRTGDRYHRATCRLVGAKSLPWNWAEGRFREDLDEAKANGVMPCKVCDPDSALPSRADS